MAVAETGSLGSGSGRSRNAVAGLIALLVIGVYLILPDANSGQSAASKGSADDVGEEVERLEIVDVSPHDPFPGGTIAVSHRPARAPLEVFGGKVRLRVLARRGDQLVAALPRDMLLGDLKVRIALLADDAPHARSKPFHIRVRTPSYRKLFRSLVGGVALVVLGIFFLSRGVRASTSLQAARLLGGVKRQRGLLLGIGALLGALAQTTTGAVGLLSGLVSSRVMSIAPATLACLAAPLGAAAAPLLVAGLIEPREGLLIVALGVVWLLLTRGRRLQALASLVLGMGLVAFGIQIFRPALEPFLADATVWSLASNLRAQNAADLLLCAGLGAIAVAAMHGPAPLIVLLLGIAQATQHADLRTLLALLAGTSAGAAIAALITAPASPNARILAKAHLCLGMLGSLIALASVDLWVFLSERLLGPLVFPLHWTDRAPVAELGLPVFVGFGMSQLLILLVLTPLVAPLCAFLEQQTRGRTGLGEKTRLRAGGALDRRALRAMLDHVLRSQQAGLLEVAALAASGTRRHGQEAEQALGSARREVEWLLGGPIELMPRSEGGDVLDGVAFSLLQLQNALDHLLHQTERLVDAQVVGASHAAAGSLQSRDPEAPLESLHHLLAESLEATRFSLAMGEPLDIDAARSREIQMNRIEATTRSTLLQPKRDVDVGESRLHVLQVVDAYEVSGNQVYRLAELLCQPHIFPLSTTPA